MAEAINPADGVRISYDAHGEGPALVFLHGSALSRAPWRGMGYVKGLPGYRYVRIDLRGHGRSDKPHEDASYTPDLMAQDVLAVMDAEGIDAAAVIGYSLGARVGWQLLVHHPERVAAFVSMGGTHRLQTGNVEKIFFPGYLDALRSGDIEKFVDGFGPGLDPATKAAFLRNDPLALAALFGFTESRYNGLDDAALSFITQPVLLIAGDRDEQRYEDGQDEAALLPHGEFVALPGRNHGGTLASVQDVLAAIKPFLDRVYPPAQAAEPVAVNAE